jgi:ADP-heptose:LPS heptosyltransferase
MMNTRLLKIVDSIIGRAACAVISLVVTTQHKAHNRLPRRITSVLLIRPGGIGDAVLLIPAIILLKRAFPRAAIDILAEKRNSGVFALCPDVSAVYHYETPAEIFKTIRKSYDVVIDSEQWHRLSAVAARMTRAPMSIGFATNERKN